MGDYFRSNEISEQYKRHRESGALERSCPLCDSAPVEMFTHWKIIPNDYPYDLIAETHHMIVPVRHIQEEVLTTEELEEFYKIKKSKLGNYDYIIEASQKKKSIPAHFHLHLISARVVKDETS